MLASKSATSASADAASITAADRRSVFAVPKGRATYLGTTDAFYPEPDLWPRIERAGERLMRTISAFKIASAFWSFPIWKVPSC